MGIFIDPARVVRVVPPADCPEGVHVVVAGEAIGRKPPTETVQGPAAGPALRNDARYHTAVEDMPQPKRMKSELTCLRIINAGPLLG